MPAGRVVILLAALGVLAVAAVAFLLTRDDAEPARGDVIAYGCEEGETLWFAICVVGADGTGRRQLTHGLEASDPSWSPDGRILFTVHRSSGTAGRVPIRRAVRRRLRRRGPAEADRQPGRLHARRADLVAGRPADRARPGRTLPSAGVAFGAIAVTSADGTGPRELTAGPLDTSPAWSPDGTEIAFTRAGGYLSNANADVYVVSASGGESRRLTTTRRRLETRARLVARQPVDRVRGFDAADAVPRPRGAARGRPRRRRRASGDGAPALQPVSRQPLLVGGRPDDRPRGLDARGLHDHRARSRRPAARGSSPSPAVREPGRHRLGARLAAGRSDGRGLTLQLL